MRNLRIANLVDRTVDADVVVIGSGVAGLATALSLAPRRVVVVSKSALGAGGSSPWAQGGVAAALGADDSPRLHALDTLEAGAGLCDPRAVSVLTGEGPERVRRLIGLGTLFDRNADGRLSMGREGAHGRRRILHAGGDRTGAEIVRALVAAVEEEPGLEILEHTLATDLAVDGGRVVGVRVESPDGESTFVRSPAVVLATGGFGQLYRRTTNPVENTGDGLAMAARAGARLVDLEFVQFHPTALDVDPDSLGAAPLPLVTEALRGEGAWLVDEDGERFMLAIDARAELAPRDIVARAIRDVQKSGSRVFLDARPTVGDAFPERFPTVFESCRRFGIDPRREPIPVTPAAHYVMAGVLTDARGRASLDGLWACGEVASTGVHGANRLASNSLLEALVFGHRVALDIADRPAEKPLPRPWSRGPIVRRETGLDNLDATAFAALRDLAWDHLGLVRDGDGLDTTLETLESWLEAGEESPRNRRRDLEVRNLWTVARAVATAARVREESRGSHTRTDFPETELAWRRRLVWTYRDEPGLPALQKVVDGDLHPGLDFLGTGTNIGHELTVGRESALAEREIA
jgi:L-aspartate oxidase